MPEIVMVGGLMRCCLATLDEERSPERVEEEPAEEGDVLHCKYCKDGEMIFSEGAWRWKE